MTVTADTTLTDEQRAQALREHLRTHGVGADERWDVETLQALHDAVR
jgi:hypothetical protein